MRARYRTALFLGGAAVIGWLGWVARDNLTVVLTSIRPGLFALSVLLGVVFTAAQGVLYARLMVKQGTKAGTGELVAAFLLSQPGKYIPGKIWTAAMQFLALKHEGGFAGIAIANVELVAVAITQMSALGLAAYWIDYPIAVLAALVVGIALSVAIMLSPTTSLLSRLPYRITIMLRINISGEPGSRPSIWDAVVLSSLVLGLNVAASLFVLFAAGSSITSTEYAPILASLYLGFAASLAVIPVPAGLGVREATTVGLGLIVAAGVPSSLLISVALLARCWQLAIDAACIGIGAAMLAFKRHMDNDAKL